MFELAAKRMFLTDALSSVAQRSSVGGVLDLARGSALGPVFSLIAIPADPEACASVEFSASTKCSAWC